MSKIRCFLALPTSDEVQTAITSLIASYQSVPSDVKWQDASKLHITLKFLGSVEIEAVKEISVHLEDRARYHSAFDIVYEGTGGFPSQHRPTTLWVGTRSSDAMTRLHRDVEDVVRNFGFTPDERPFRPHITIGRVKGNRNLDRLTAKVKSVTFEPVTARCAEILVMRSDLQSDTSRYTVIQSIPLRL
ncbi:MAG TPA: RNA 2',3'-cyclic phosphodiesterase [Bacteroidota bacterium]